MSRRFATRSEYEAWKTSRSAGGPPAAMPVPDPVDEAPAGAQRKEFKVEVIVEGALGTLLFGASKLPVDKLEAVLNRYGFAGWDVAFMLIERKRFLLFWRREAAIVTFSRERQS